MSLLSALSADSSRIGAVSSVWSRAEEIRMGLHEQVIMYGNSAGQDFFALSEIGVSLRFSTYNEQGIIPEPGAVNPQVHTFPETGSSAPEANAITDSESSMGDIRSFILKQTLFLLLESLKHMGVVPQGTVDESTDEGDNRAVSTTLIRIDIVEMYHSISINDGTMGFEDFSAGATAQRIVNFALSFYSGGNRTEFADMARAAIQKGFEMAAQFLGGWLPDVSYETYELVMRALDEFVADSSLEESAVTVDFTV